MRLILIYAYILPVFVVSQEYIKIIRTDINIRMEPTTSSHIVGHAFNGEIYILNGEREKWYSVLLPSGETRWIYKKLAEKTEFSNKMSQDIDIVSIQEELKVASDKANEDANEEIIFGLNKSDINNILFDRYTLLTLQNFSISPAYYNYIMEYRHPSRNNIIKPISEHLTSVSHIDYDLFKIDFANIYLETRRCFKLGVNLDAMIFMYYEDNEFVQKLCFEDGYGTGFNNCYNIKNIYESVLEEPNLIVLTKEGKIKKTNLVLKETILDLPE